MDRGLNRGPIDRDLTDKSPTDKDPANKAPVDRDPVDRAPANRAAVEKVSKDKSFRYGDLTKLYIRILHWKKPVIGHTRMGLRDKWNTS